ncbi:leucine-rich repeat-containing protein 72 [Erpetoichthys calabaricus]|uniref:Leucine-rich melanocyte differentiation-associated protein-like n=1 Tax=Erpetoichthys calabaricus TaxID=27687 RepID=A0A8C4S3K0_ERPCA|nr:leucine-rich repeat-containing protein 72 [Erpetoichthys calabaricus]XP_051785902.1 leucine-rich repeat-containing protein 72 [Erpetoichthys calabaricus]XP_051785903.1 leucine-rich repeat-containing protein 72 [Erpetoichthys calabaricus]XP_051785904.1 leucine-rich repeat-containing protein 72 [Erpetoichthys calabaricus]
MLGMQSLSFAYQNLEEIPYTSILLHRDTLEVLDLSNNSLQESPSLLGSLDKLSTLILDCNIFTSHVKFPYMPSMTTVYINKNRIRNLPIFVEEVKKKFPNIRMLSMMNNEAAPSYFNGGTLKQYVDYRQYVISQIPGLQVLDDHKVLENERMEAAKVYRYHKSVKSQKRKGTTT